MLRLTPKIFWILALLVTLATPVISQDRHSEKSQQIPTGDGGMETLVADGATLRLLTEDCSFTEGPIANRQGEVFFTDQPNNRILKVDLDESVSVFLENAGRSNGMYFIEDNVLLACADEQNELWAIAPDGSHQVLFGEYAGKKLNGPNDLWVHPNGWIYFTDPYYQRPWWEHKSMPQDGQHVYRVNRSGTGMIRLPAKFKQPNGIVGDAARGLLYIADIGDSKTFRFEINKDGALGDAELFCNEGSDGMTLDELGNLYLTNANGVVVYSPTGERLGVISTGKNWTANVCFGGHDFKKLFITASDSLFVIDMRIAGLR